MPIRKFAITLARTVTERLTINVDAASKQDALVRIGALTKDSPDDEWERDVGPTRVGRVERAAAAEADPMAVPARLQRAGSAS